MKKEKPINARFWIFWNGDYVKLTLKPDTEVTFGYSQTHDEGYCAVHETYSYDGITVDCESHSSGRDCDGRHSSTSNDHAKVSELKVNPCLRYDYNTGAMTVIPGMLRPNWQAGRTRCYDQYAEAAGY